MSSTSKLILYGAEESPPVRAVLLTLKALNLTYEFRFVNLLGGEHLKPEYAKINPQRTLPALQDDDVTIWDSHAICAYLVRKFGNNTQLYPQDFYQRAIVDQRLHFENGILFSSCLRPLVSAILKAEAAIAEILKDKIERIHEAYQILETFLDGRQYMAGSELTIADFSIVSSTSVLHMAICPVDATRYPRLSAWLTRMATLPYYEEANLKGAKMFCEFIKSKLPKETAKLWKKAVADIKSNGGVNKA